MDSKRILIVDDQDDIRDLLLKRLEAAGYDVIAAADGQTALKRAREDGPDLIVLDMMLPDVQGATVCAQLKAEEAFQQIPIIILSARDGDYDKDIGRAVKADAYMTKPFQTEDLLAKIQDFFRTKAAGN